MKQLQCLNFSSLNFLLLDLLIMKKRQMMPIQDDFAFSNMTVIGATLCFFKPDIKQNTSNVHDDFKYIRNPLFLI